MKKRWWQRKRWRTLIALSPLIVLAMLWGCFGYSSVCRDCGLIQHTTDWQIPLTRLTYWRFQSTETTPLSNAVNKCGLVQPHNHTWVFASGSGNGALCAIGSGRFLRPVATSPDVTAFIEAVAAYRGQVIGRAWLTALLDPQHREVADIMGIADVPTTGFPTRQPFDDWWSSHQEDFDFLFSKHPPLAMPTTMPTTQPK